MLFASILGRRAIIKWKLDVAVLRENILGYGRRRFAAAAVPYRVWGISKRNAPRWRRVVVARVAQTERA